MAHVHEFYVIGRVEAGERTLELNGAHRHIARGSLIVLNPGDVHGCAQEGEEPFTYDCFTVSAALLDDARLSFPAKDEPGIQSAYDDALRALRAGLLGPGYRICNQSRHGEPFPQGGSGAVGQYVGASNGTVADALNHKRL